MDKYIEKIKNNQNLSFEESKTVFQLLMEGKANDDQISQILGMNSMNAGTGNTE